MEFKINKNSPIRIPCFSLLIFVSHVLLAFPVYADTQSDSVLADAAMALKDNNFIRARMLYMQLASRDDPRALFNLAVMEKKGLGTPANPFEARALFEKASQHKLVDAYNSIQLASIKPAKGQRVQVIQTAQEWIRAQNANYYTLQLASSTNRKLIEKYYNENHLQGIAGYYVNRRQSEDWYALVYGAYPTVGEANAAIASLPKDLRKWSPWVRKLKEIQRLIKP